MMYSPRSDEWERLPWLPDAPGRAVRRPQPVFPVSWLATLMLAVAVGSFWAGTTSIRDEQRTDRAASAVAMTGDESSIMALDLFNARKLERRTPRANAPY